MAKHVGVKLPDDLFNLLQSGQTIGILATFSEKGIPSATPVQWLYPKGRESILLTINKEHEAYHNMVWQKKVTFCFIGENNIVYSVLGRAGVVLAPSTVNALFHVVRIDIIEIKSDRSVLTQIDAGIQWSYVSAEVEEFARALMEELRDLAETL